MQFSYTALTSDNKKITGVLDVETKEAAEAELHKMGVAILSVNEISAEEAAKIQEKKEEVKVEKGIQTFTFLATDPNNKEVEGTIDAIDDYSAYRRLRTEYKFTVNNVYQADATEPEKEAAKAKLAEFEAQLEADTSQVEGEERGSEEDLGTGAEDDINKELIAEIDRVIINTKKVLEVHGEFFSNELLKEIENTLGTLERVRTSNNVKHITEVSNELYELVSNPDKVEDVDNESFDSLKEEIGDSALVKREFEIYQKAIEATGIKRIFANITKRLKDMTAPPEGEAGKPAVGYFKKMKLKFHNMLEKSAKKKRLKRAEIIKKAKKPKSKFGIFLEKFGSYLKTTNPILKKTRKKEMVRAFKAIFKKGGEEEVEAEEAAEKEAKETKKTAKAKTKPGKRDFTHIFVEMDSFIGWLLCFYIIYFFLVNFSLEKNIGLKPEFVFKTLKTPLLLNITIFLLLIHFALRIKTLHFRQNALASLFLFFLSLSTYILLIVNF